MGGHLRRRTLPQKLVSMSLLGLSEDEDGMNPGAWSYKYLQWRSGSSADGCSAPEHVHGPSAWNCFDT